MKGRGSGRPSADGRKRDRYMPTHDALPIRKLASARRVRLVANACPIWAPLSLIHVNLIMIPTSKPRSGAGNPGRHDLNYSAMRAPVCEPRCSSYRGAHRSVRKPLIFGSSWFADRTPKCPSRVCAVVRRRFSSGCKALPAAAPAGSNRSGHGGDEMAEAFGIACHALVTARVCRPQRE